MIAPILHILPMTTIRRERTMPIPGRVIVRRGQKVTPKDVIAEANMAPKHLLLNVARGLGISITKTDPLIQRSVGDRVDEGDLIAGPVGLARRVVRAPVSGEIVLIGDGQVLLQTESAPFQLRAGLAGIVMQLIPDRGAVIETTGALIQGNWGNNRTDFGLVQAKMANPGDPLRADQLDVSLRGTIVLGGYCEDPKALVIAAEIPLKGLILSSMAASLAPMAAKAPFPIVLVEGFGRIPMDPSSYKLLITNQTREMSINAEPFDRFKGTRPEIVIPLPATAPPSAPVDREDFAPNQTVRILRAPHPAVIGTINALYSKQVDFPSGLIAPAAEVRLENGDLIMIPLANLEVLA